MAGLTGQSTTQIKTALEMLQKALPGLQMGSKLHNAVMKAITEIAKEVQTHEGDQSAMVQQLAQLAAAARQQPQQAAMMRQFPQAGPPGGGGGPPSPLGMAA
jgi:hypothetical protein